MTQQELRVRQATDEDYDSVVDFTSDIWTHRSGDYIPHVYHDWIAGDGDTQRTFVVDTGDDIGGICQAVLLSEHEAWIQGMRSNPEFRGEGIANLLNDAAFDWAAERGATVARNMVFSWNTAGLGASRAAGFEPGVEFRWAHPEPKTDALAALDTDATITHDADAAWSHWVASEARDVLGGLALHPEESWALSELARETLQDLREDTTVLTVQNDGTRAMAFRIRDYDRENDDGETVHWAEYGGATWDDADAARALFAAVAEDAAALDADETRVLIPETPRHVTDVAYARAGTSDEPKFLLECDLTDRRSRVTVGSSGNRGQTFVLWSHGFTSIAMKPCHNCQTVIDEYVLDKQLEPLRELTVDDFNVCADCVTIVADACVECGGAVYDPRSASVTPDYCPACRSDLIDRTGHDPGWHCGAVST